MSLLYPARPVPTGHTTDTVTLTRPARRHLQAQARAAASAARPDDATVPAYLGVIDHEAAAAAAEAAVEYIRAQAPRLTVMADWLQLDPALPPPPGATGPAARRAAAAHYTWTRATGDAAAALHDYDQARTALAYTFARIDQTRRTRRALFAATYTTHHPTGTAPSTGSGTIQSHQITDDTFPDQTGTDCQASYLVPDEHLTVAATRTQLERLRTPPDARHP